LKINWEPDLFERKLKEKLKENSLLPGLYISERTTPLKHEKLIWDGPYPFLLRQNILNDSFRHLLLERLALAGFMNDVKLDFDTSWKGLWSLPF